MGLRNSVLGISGCLALLATTVHAQEPGFAGFYPSYPVPGYPQQAAGWSGPAGMVGSWFGAARGPAHWPAPAWGYPTYAYLPPATPAGYPRPAASSDPGGQPVPAFQPVSFRPQPCMPCPAPCGPAPLPQQFPTAPLPPCEAPPGAPPPKAEEVPPAKEPTPKAKEPAPKKEEAAPSTPETPPAEQPETPSAPQGAAGAGTTFAANMIGDFIGPASTRVVNRQIILIENLRQLLPLITTQAGITTPINIQVPVNVTTTVQVFNAALSGFKISENESPRPATRFFLNYTYYNDAVAPGNAGAGFQNNTSFIADFSSVTNQVTQALLHEQQVANGIFPVGTLIVPADVPRGTAATVGAATTQLQTLAATNPNQFFATTGFGPARLQIHQGVIGFEKTFLDGNASFGLRAPIFGQQGDGSLSESDFGDMTLILKYALLNDCKSGNILSTGLALTVPTGPTNPTVDGNIHPVFLQPYVGYIYNFSKRLYGHGFLSVAVPTDMRDVVLLFNDVGIGYWLYQSPKSEGLLGLTGIVPTFEAHINTPLTHRGLLSDPIGLPDLIDLVAGVTFVAGKRDLTIAAGTPVTGPRPFDFELRAFMNFRF